jgi:NTE family protein
MVGGAWMLGCLRALATKTGWDPSRADHLVGTSVGALLAALIAGGEPPLSAAMDARTAAVYRRDGFPWPVPGSLRLIVSALLHHNPQQLLMTMVGLLPRGPVSTDPIKDAVRRATPKGWPESPVLWIVACDYETGERVVFGRADAPPAELPEAVAASCAIPAFYQPERIRDRRYIDGGLYSYSNLDLLAERQLDLVICLNPMSSPGVLSGRANPLDRVIALAQQAAHRRLEHEAAMVEAFGSHVVVLEPGPKDLQAMGRNLMSRRRIQDVMEVAFHSAAAKLDQEDLRSLHDAFRATGSNLWDRPGSAAASQFQR